MPFDGELKEVGLRTATNGGSTVVGVHVNQDPAIVTDTQTLNSGTFTTFTLSGSFSRGDSIAVSVDPTTAVNQVYGYAVFEWDTNTG